MNILETKPIKEFKSLYKHFVKQRKGVVSFNSVYTQRRDAYSLPIPQNTLQRITGFKAQMEKVCCRPHRGSPQTASGPRLGFWTPLAYC